MPDTVATAGGSLWHGAWVVLRLALVTYLAALLFTAGCQRRLIYFPTRTGEADLLASAPAAGLAPWRDAGGQVIGWQRLGAPNELAADDDCLLVFHGNAGCAVDRGYLMNALRSRADRPGLSVLLCEYPGYGARPGKPTEKNLFATADAALQQARKERTGRIFLAGESLGSGVACRLAANHPDLVAGVLLITPFTSLTDVARAHYPVLPVGLFLLDRYNNVAALRDYRGPVAVLLAEKDEMVPARLGRRLYDAYAGPKRLWTQPGRTHNTLDYDPALPLWKEIAGFLRSGSKG